MPVLVHLQSSLGAQHHCRNQATDYNRPTNRIKDTLSYQLRAKSTSDARSNCLKGVGLVQSRGLHACKKWLQEVAHGEAFASKGCMEGGRQEMQERTQACKEAWKEARKEARKAQGSKEHRRKQGSGVCRKPNKEVMQPGRRTQGSKEASNPASNGSTSELAPHAAKKQARKQSGQQAMEQGCKHATSRWFIGRCSKPSHSTDENQSTNTSTYP